ncbi:MAG: glycine cleavage system aminomethyltransferase GcvT [Deltaproteobacteria bacterium]|nr:glycine cleavage system aminomethyltransferase GcvT [Deltaproteobacteria bacterium]
MLKRTPLFEIHKKLGARMVEFGGWEMPVTYPEGVLAEHRRVRSGVGLFDICHMGEILVTGAGAEDFINHITTNDIRKIEDGGCQYAACCYDNGGVVDDIISYRYNTEKYLVIVNASNTEKDFDWFQKNTPAGVKVENVSPQYCQLALQGPVADKVLQPLVNIPLDRLGYYRFAETKFSGKTQIILSRTGYTGEDGFEIYGPWNEAPRLWEALMEAGRPFEIAPIGLAARDTLRLEAAYSLYGHEISDSINPLEARLGWIVKLDKKEFIGKETLRKISEEGVKRKIVGLEMVDAGISRQGFEVFHEDRKIGAVTSGTFSPALERAIALCLIDAAHAAVGTELAVQVRKQRLKAKVIPLPFYKRK